jgi:hypothetical protein
MCVAHKEGARDKPSCLTKREREKREERMCVVAHKEGAPSAKHVLQECACNVRGFMCLVVVPNRDSCFLFFVCWFFFSKSLCCALKKGQC